jgi:tetratricopeptide (TPR) repeat protein
LAKAQAEAGEVDAGLETADRILGDMRKYTVQEMATGLARLGKFKEAFRVAERVGDDAQRDIALMDISRGQAEVREFQEALKTVDMIKSPFLRVLALSGNQYEQMGGIAVLQATAGDRAGARKTVLQAREIAEKMARDSQAGRAWASVAIAEARLGDFAAAKQTLKRITVRDAAAPEEASQNRCLALQQIAVAEAKADRFDDALATARSLPTGNRGGTLAAIAERRARAGQREDCRALFAEALKIAEAISDPLAKSGLYHDIATRQAETGEYDAAEKTVALRGGDESLTRSNIAYARAKRRDFAGALQAAEKIKGNDFWKGLTLEFIAELQTESGDERAALARAEAVTSPADKAATLMGIVAGRFARLESKKRVSTP